jgi:glycosyltransferase involved in cell wall biosynthesis
MRSEVDISIVIPTKNEEISVGKFVAWCNEGLARLGLKGEIILLDCSTDRTPEIATKAGARVIKVEVPGLGNAYAIGRSHARGKWVVLGDADCTYDFRNLKPFIDELQSGADFVVGNRFKGGIEKGSMPFHHQYFGSPITSWIFKRSLGIPTGDIHCGMRALTGDLYRELPFMEGGWEYSTEMIVSARNLGAKISEVPIHFFKEPEGRVSHHKRSSWTSPFIAGWGTLRVTTTYMFDRLFVKPGLCLAVAATVANLLISIFPGFFLGKLHLGLIAQSVLLFASALSSLAFAIGVLSRFIYYRVETPIERIGSSQFSKRLFTFSVLITIGEIALTIPLLAAWARGLGRSSTTSPYDSVIVSNWLAMTSVFVVVSASLIVSLIASHARKYRASISQISIS